MFEVLSWKGTCMVNWTSLPGNKIFKNMCHPIKRIIAFHKELLHSATLTFCCITLRQAINPDLAEYDSNQTTNLNYQQAFPACRAASTFCWPPDFDRLQRVASTTKFAQVLLRGVFVFVSRKSPSLPGVSSIRQWELFEQLNPLLYPKRYSNKFLVGYTVECIYGVRE